MEKAIKKQEKNKVMVLLEEVQKSNKDKDKMKKMIRHLLKVVRAYNDVNSDFIFSVRNLELKNKRLRKLLDSVLQKKRILSSNGGH